MITINGTSLPIVATVCITPPKDDPTVFKNAINNIVTIDITKTIIIAVIVIIPAKTHAIIPSPGPPLVAVYIA